MAVRKTQNTKDISMPKYLVLDEDEYFLIQCSPDRLSQEIIERWDEDYVTNSIIYDITNLSPMKLKASYSLQHKD